MIKSYLFWCTFLSLLWNVAPESCSPNCGRCDRGWTGIHCNIPCNYNCLNCTMDGGCERCYLGYYVQHKRCEQCSHGCYQNASTAFQICDHVDGGCIPACDQIDGECTLGCKPGWSGKICFSQCSVLCTDRLCNRDTSCCTNGCRKPFYGGCKCDDPCSSNCVNGTCYQNKTCMEGCEFNYWGADCNQECSDICAHGQGNSTSICDRNGMCIFGCKNTLQPCPVKCLERDCNAIYGHCPQVCNPNCAEAPPDTAANISNETALTCLYGCKGNFDGVKCHTCKRGWTGIYCNITCDYNCLDCTLDGGCEQCYPGYYVRDKGCNQCWITCYQNDSTFFPACNDVDGGCKPVCDQNDGGCTFGCDLGWYGKMCNARCPIRCIDSLCTRGDGCCTNGCKYQTKGGCQCDELCGSNCANGTCYQNKTCMDGCELNHWGPDCNQECSDSCAQGQGNSTAVCDRNGICVHGCKKTFMGSDCLQSCPVTCPERDCNATSGHCLQAENSVAPREGTTKSYFLTFCLQLLIYFRLAVY